MSRRIRTTKQARNARLIVEATCYLGDPNCAGCTRQRARSQAFLDKRAEMKRGEA